MAKKKPKSGKALSADKREQMYQVFFKHGTLQSVVKESSVCTKTAMKYKKLDQWDARVAKTKHLAASKVDKKNSNQLARDIKLVDNALAVYAATLIGKIPCPHCSKDVPIPKLIPKFGDIEKVMKLKMLITGGLVIDEDAIIIRVKNTPESLKEL